VSEEAARQIEREDLSLRVAEAPQLAQGLASESKVVGLVLPLLPAEVSAEALGATLGATLAAGANEAFSLSALAHELSWQTAMAELLAMVRLEGVAAVDAAAAQAASAHALELLLAASTEEAAPLLRSEPPTNESTSEQANLRSAAAFVDTPFGDAGVSVLSLQNKDLFGFEVEKPAPPALAAEFDQGSRQGIDFDLFGTEGGTAVISLSKNDPGAGSGGLTPLEHGSGSAGGAVIGGIAGNGDPPQGVIKLAEGPNNVTMDLDAVLQNANGSDSLLVRGDGDDKLKLIGDWFLVSEDPTKSMAVYAHSDSNATVTADHIEVILA